VKQEDVDAALMVIALNVLRDELGHARENPPLALAFVRKSPKKGARAQVAGW
jgi:hypothetical protein